MSSGPAPEREAQFARFYDLEYREYSEDVDFYVQFARALDPEARLPVLEFGCGTGRVLLALAAAGFRTTGVDASAAMLAICAARASERGLSDAITLARMQMQDAASLPGGPFNMAFCSLNTFAYLTNTRAQLQMLSAARSALVQHGILIIDLTPPLPHLLPPSDNEVVHQGSYQDNENNELVHKFVTGFHRPSEQMHHVRLIYDIESANGSLRRFSREELFRWTGRFEMQLLLERAGFSLDKLYGSYDLDDYADESERMIFIART